MRTALLLIPMLSLPAAGSDPRRESIQDTPGAITAIDAEELSLKSLPTDLSQLAGITPGVTGGNNSAVNLRGLSASAFLQTRYTASKRDDSLLGDDDLSLGFNVPLAEITIAGYGTDSIGGVISIITRGGSNGDLELENAFANWSINDTLSAQIGQFRPAIRREHMVHESQLGGLSKSLSSEFFGGGYQQGIQLGSGLDETSAWSWSTFLSDGPGSDNSAYDSANEFDLAFGGRFQYRPFGTWNQFADVTAFRGTEPGLLLGLGGYIAMDGDTNPSTTNDEMLCALGFDIGYENDGWRAGGTFDWYQEDVDNSPTFNFLGWGVEGGVFINDRTELFARIEQIIADDDLALAEDEFMFIGGGVNYFPVIDSHAVRLSADVTWALDPTTPLIGLGAPGGQVIGANAPYGFVGSSQDNEIVFRMQGQWRF